MFTRMLEPIVVIVGFRYGFYDPLQTGTFEWYQRPQPNEVYIGKDDSIGVPYNCVTGVLKCYRDQGVLPFAAMTVAPFNTPPSETQTILFQQFDDAQNKYTQCTTDDTTGPRSGINNGELLDFPYYQNIAWIKSMTIENLIDPCNELLSGGSGSVSASAEVTAKNVWAVDFTLPAPTLKDQWWGQPDIAKFGWVCSMHVNATNAWFGKLRWINFQKSRIFFSDRE